MHIPSRRHLGPVFNEVPELYDRVRPGTPTRSRGPRRDLRVDALSSVLEVGCGTGQATRSLGRPVPGVPPSSRGRTWPCSHVERLAVFPNVDVETSSFETWEDRGRRFDLLVAASSWHWVDPSIGWRRARAVLRPGGWMALLGNVVVRRPGEPEVYAATADLHDRFAPGTTGGGIPRRRIGSCERRGVGPPRCPGPSSVLRRAVVPDGAMVRRGGSPTFCDRRPFTATRPRCPRATARRDRRTVRTEMDDRVARRYLSVLRVGPRAD